MSAGDPSTFSSGESDVLRPRHRTNGHHRSNLGCGSDGGGVNCDSGFDVNGEVLRDLSRGGGGGGDGFWSGLDYISTILPDVSSSEDDPIYSQTNGSIFPPFHKFVNGTATTDIIRNTILGSGEVGDGGTFSSRFSTTTLTPPFEGESEEDPLTLSTWLLVAFFTTLIVITIVGNLLVCLSVILVRKLRKPQNYLLVSLAISDLFVAVFVMPYAVAFEVYGGKWPFNNALCDLWVSADVLCCTASILNLCGISVDRYRAITTPLEYSSKTTPRRMLAVIFVVWLGSACVSLPPVLLLGNVHEDSHKNSFCSVSQNFWYQIYATMASFYVPLCVMVVVYVKILRVVADKKKQMGWKPPHHHQSIHRTASSSVTTNHSSLCGGGTSTLLVSNSPGGGPPPQHALVTRALVTSSVGGSPVTVSTIVSNTPSCTSSPARRGSLSTMSSITAAPTPPTGARGCPTVPVPLTPIHNEDTTCGGNNNKKDSTASQNAAVTTPLLSSSGGKKNPSKGTYQKQKSNNRSNSHCMRMNSRNSLNANHSAAAGTSAGPNHSNQNGGNGSTVTYFFSSSTIHRIKKEKLFGGLKEHKASTTLGIIMSAFVICWLPFFVLALLRPFLSINGVEIPPWITSLFNWLGWANSALNPVIYATLNRDFRKPFREILCLRCSTLDDMMRREFYQQQFGDDRENYLRRVSRPHTENEPVSTTEGPTNV